MTAKELRIGNYLNWIRYKPLLMQVEMVNIHTKIECSDNNGIGAIEWAKDNMFKPIPLTEEWLVKFGFKFDVGYHLGDLKKIRIDYYDDSNIWNIAQMIGSMPMYIDVKIQYVHQLQNIYFALTGNELTLK